MADEPITAEDTTPFAESERPDRRDWWSMTKWLWSAGGGRLSHLALMRSSPAARSYSRRTLLPITVVAAITWMSLTGWHAVTMFPVEAGGQPPEPSGTGWVHMATVPAGTIHPATNPSRVISWWWNPVLASIGAVGAFVCALVLSVVLTSVLRRGVERSLLVEYRGQHRLSAALCYSVGWATPLIPAGLILALLPLCRMAAVAEWPIRPPTSVVYFPAALVAGLAVVMVWFGLIRLASTVPVRARSRVVLFCAVAMPLITAALSVGVAWGLWWLQADLLTPWMGLQW